MDERGGVKAVGRSWVALIAVLAIVACESAGATAPRERDPEDSPELDPSVDPLADGAVPDPVFTPDDFAAGEVDVVSVVRTGEERKPISPLIYGLNRITAAEGAEPAVLKAVSFVRRGGDRANAYNWETNVSNGSHSNGFVSDLYLAEGLGSPNAPAAVDLAMITRNRAAGRGSMVPFVLNGYVAGPVGGGIPYDSPGGWDREEYFEEVGLVKPTPFASTPDLDDGVVYSDEHLDYLRKQFQEDILAEGPGRLMVGIDNEPDLYAYNFPMLQSGGGDDLYADNGVKIGNRVTGAEFTARFLTFAKRVKTMAANAYIVGPSHFHFDGWTTWNDSMPEHSGLGTWYMDEFLTAVKNESTTFGTRLLDTWDVHWYPQTLSDGTYVWDLDDSRRELTAAEIDAIVQSPRSYWDPEFDEDSWITRDHLKGPAYILTRLKDRLAAGYPGTKLGISEYFPGGCAHIASGLAVADSLGIFARMEVGLAAMWPTCDRLEYAFGALQLLRNADTKGLRFADTVVKVEHPEKAETSVYAGSDDPKRVTMLVINKTSTTRKVGLRAFNAAKLSKVDIYRIDAAHPSPHLAAEDTLSKLNAYAYDAPAMSAALLVFSAP